MRKRNSVKKLGKKVAHRKSMIKGQLDTLFTYGKIKTTSVKAKVVKVKAMELMTKVAKIEDNVTRVRLLKNEFFIPESRKNIVKYIMLPEKAVKIVKVGHRSGDNTEVSELTLVNFSKIVTNDDKSKKKDKKAKASKVEKVSASPQKSKKTDETKKVEKATLTDEKKAVSEKAVETKKTEVPVAKKIEEIKKAKSEIPHIDKEKSKKSLSFAQRLRETFTGKKERARTRSGI